MPPDAEMNWLSAEQSNSSVIVGDVAILKLFRRVSAGPHPEAEMGRYLTDQGFAGAAPLLGEVVRVGADGDVARAGHRASVSSATRATPSPGRWTCCCATCRTWPAVTKPPPPMPNGTKTTTPSPACSAPAWARCMRCWRARPTMPISRRCRPTHEMAQHWGQQAEQQLATAFTALENQQQEWSEGAAQDLNG